MNERKLGYWDLKRNVEYAAFDGERRLPKNYTIDADGKMFNSEGGPGKLGSTKSGCSWIPVAEGIHFVEAASLEKEVTPVVAAKMTTKARKVKAEVVAGPVDILRVKEGTIYISNDPALKGMRLARYKNELYRVDRENVPVQVLNGIRISLDAKFKAVGETKGRNLLAVPVEPTPLWKKLKSKTAVLEMA